MVIDMKLTVVTNQGSTIEYERVADIKCTRIRGIKDEISFYNANVFGEIIRNWQYLSDISSIVLTAD